MSKVNKLNRLRYKLHKVLNCSKEELSKLSSEQLAYVNHYIIKSSFLEACPGSGKTEVIGIKAAWEISRWATPNAGLAVVTFTNSAAKELNLRVRKYGNVRMELFPHFTGTFDSWMHSYILQPFSHYLTRYSGKDGDKSIRLIDADSTAGFLANYSTNLWKAPRQQPIEVTQYYFNPDFSVVSGVDDTVDSLLTGITLQEFTNLKQKKKAFIQAGFATYADAEMLCRILLTKYPVLAQRLSSRFPQIIVDECQDLSLGQLDLLETLRNNGTALHFVGDLNQSIYEFRKVNPQDTENYIQEKAFIKLRLTNNYRSCQPIVSVCENIVGNPQAVTGHHVQRVPAPCQLWEYDDVSYHQLPVRFSQLLTANQIPAKKAVILARGKSTLKPFRHQHSTSGLTKIEMAALAFYNWHKPNRTTDELTNALSYAGKVLCFLGCSGKGDPRNQFCPEGIPAVQWRLTLKSFLEGGAGLYPFTTNGQNLSWSQWSAKLKLHLAPLWGTIKEIENEWDDVKTKIRAPQGRGAVRVNEIYTANPHQNLFRTTTIHSVKGETVEAVLLVSSQDARSKGGFYKHWLREGQFDPEHIRFAYVACSRPRSILVIATPRLTVANRQKLETLGLTFI